MRSSCCLLSVVLLATMPAMGQQPAQQSTPPKTPGKSATQPKNAPPNPGAISDGLYRNPAFSFSYKIPYGWVDRTEQMRKDSLPDSKSLLLLAIFERPPEAKGDRVNSAVIIAAEPVSAYPGLKTADDYFDPLTELTTSKGFQVVEEPYEFEVGKKKLIRGDFKKDVAGLTMYQVSLVMLEKSYIVSFTFIADNEDELEAQIMDLKVSSAAAPAKPPAQR